MSVTAAQGLRRLGRARRDPRASRRTSRSCARCRRRPAPRCGRRTACRRRRSRSSKRAPRARRAAGGRDQLRRRERGDRRAQGDADALATAAQAAALLGLAPEQVLVLSTGVIGAPLPLERLLTGPRRRGRRALRRRRRRRGRGDPHHRHAREDGRRRTATGFTVGGMAKGSGMIHPNLATMLAVVTTDYPLEPGEAIAFLRPAVDDELQRDHRRRRVLDERRRRAALLRRAAASSGRPRATRAFALALRAVCADLVARRSSPTARARRCSPRSPSPAPRARPRRRRSHSGSRPRRSSRRRSSAATRTGAAC